MARASQELHGEAIAVLGRDPAAIGAKDGLLHGDFIAGRLDPGQQIGVESACGNASSGNGGSASATADAGVITVGDINSGGNPVSAGDIGNVGEQIELIEDATADAVALEAAASEKEVKKTVRVELMPVAEKDGVAPTEEEVGRPVEQGAVVVEAGVVASFEEKAVAVEATAAVAATQRRRVTAPAVAIADGVAATSAPAPVPTPPPAVAPVPSAATVVAVVALPRIGSRPFGAVGWSTESAGLFDFPPSRPPPPLPSRSDGRRPGRVPARSSNV